MISAGEHTIFYRGLRGRGRQLRREGSRCGAAGASCGGKVRGTLVKRFVGEKRKGEGLLGIFGDAKSRRGQNLDPRKCSGELGEDQRIVGATAGYNKLVNFCFAQHETVQRVDDRESGEDCRGTNEVVGLGAMTPAEGENFFHINMAIIFASCGLGRREL